VKLTVEGIDRMYLNVFVPRLQHETGIVGVIPGASRAAIAVCGVWAVIAGAGWKANRS
jgi:hypothetical protein